MKRVAVITPYVPPNIIGLYKGSSSKLCEAFLNCRKEYEGTGGVQHEN